MTLRLAGHPALALVALLALALTLPLPFVEPWRQIENRAYDWLSTVTLPAADSESPVIVGIDEPSFAEIARAWPWPRRLHADLIRSLDAAGAKVIVFDV
ncbi:MAG: CHASE2 domain-containing protein, partial [Alphaproteobacteria bacterium]|nr:CHASE2 domain-containing protein [Alphaproteobacteria bacterium]